MPRKTTRRAAIGSGLGLGGIAALGQEGVQADETAARPPLVIGLIDMEAVVTGYRKFASQREEITKDAQVRKTELERFMKKAQEDVEDIQRAPEGSPEHERLKRKIEEAQKKLQADTAKAQREFALRDAGAMKGVVEEVWKAVEAVARRKGLTLVQRLSRNPMDGDKPETVSDALARSTVWFDPHLDITSDVLKELNGR
jgi:Skp family chaperone for outer membrane proteins